MVALCGGRVGWLASATRKAKGKGKGDDEREGGDEVQTKSILERLIRNDCWWCS
jgi:hypothetical protein